MSKKNITEIYNRLSEHFPKWEKIKDLIDQNIDISLNLAQSGHPGGSRSKVHAFVTLVFGGFMRWDIRHPEARFADRFILGAGHTCPMIYATLALFTEALRVKYQQTKDEKYNISVPEKTLYWEDLLTLRQKGGLPGHAEMKGKTHFFKWNTGPSGHGLSSAAGQAVALKRANAEDVRVLVFEGEGGLTPGASHETKNIAWSLGLDNLYFFIDWNNFGIDPNSYNWMIHGTPEDWFRPYGWRVFGTEQGSDWGSLLQPMLEMFYTEHEKNIPSMMWFKTRKGRGYMIYDNNSHGAPHGMNNDLYWQTKKAFADKYNVEFDGFGQSAPATFDEAKEQTKNNLQQIINVLHDDQELINYITDTLITSAAEVPTEIPAIHINTQTNPIDDPVLYDYENYPSELFVAPGTKTANRSALGTFGAWLNAYCHQKYNRPLFLACSADLADSTKVSGFAKSWQDFSGYGWYHRDTNPDGILLPQPITEFGNAGLMAGLASVNFSETPYENYDGFYGICSTFSAFTYLKYGPLRLFSQLVQDSSIKLGKMILVASHTGPETGEDARTHFGIFSPGVTQLFPDDHILNLHPWEYNEVPVVMGAALGSSYQLIAIHLNRPKIVVPDREALGMDSHFEAARGAYIIRNYDESKPKMGTIIVQGASSTYNIVRILPELDKAGLNIKIVAAISWQLYNQQSEEWKHRVLPLHDWVDSTVVTNAARRLMHDWIFSKVSEEYAMSTDFDNRWRTGGKSDEMVEEAHLSPEWLLKGIEKFARERESRLKRIMG